MQFVQVTLMFSSVHQRSAAVQANNTVRGLTSESLSRAASAGRPCQTVRRALQAWGGNSNTSGNVTTPVPLSQYQAGLVTLLNKDNLQKTSLCTQQCHKHECGWSSLPPCLCNVSIEKKNKKKVDLRPVSHLAANTSLVDTQWKEYERLPSSDPCTDAAH